MIEKAINKILSLAEPHTIDFLNQRYADKELHRLPANLRAHPIYFTTLSGLVDYIAYMDGDRKEELCYFIHVLNEDSARLVSSLDGDREREVLAVANDVIDAPGGAGEAEAMQNLKEYLKRELAERDVKDVLVLA